MQKLIGPLPTYLFTAKEEEEIRKKCEAIIAAKKTEEHYQVDPRSQSLRQVTGKMGELAVEAWLGKTFVDFTVGNSKKYNVPDLYDTGYNVGIKCVNVGSAHVVMANPTCPEILCQRDGDKITILGIATVPDLIKYSDISLIKDEKLRARGTKKGFIAYNKLMKPEKWNIGRFILPKAV